MDFEINDSDFYIDEYVFALISFLNERINSSNEVEFGYKRIESNDDTSIKKLYNDNQCLSLESDDEYIDYLLLENNKLLRISHEKTNDPNIFSSFVSFVLYKENEYILEINSRKKGIINVQILNKDNKKINDTEEYLPTHINQLPKKINLKEIIKPITIEQLLKNGKKKEKQLCK